MLQIELTMFHECVRLLYIPYCTDARTCLVFVQSEIKIVSLGDTLGISLIAIVHTFF